MSTRKEYSKEFKEEAVRLVQQTANKSQVARALGIPASMLSRWEQQLSRDGEKAFPGKEKAQLSEVDQLKKELARLIEENEILKKAVGIFTKHLQ